MHTPIREIGAEIDKNETTFLGRRRHMKLRGRRVLSSLVAAGMIAAVQVPFDVAAQPVAPKTDAQKACVAAIKDDVEKGRADVPLITPPGPLDLAALKGKTIWFIPISFNQFASDWEAGLKEAADIAGVKLVTFDTKGSISAANEAVSQAVAQKADGIIILAIRPSVIAGPVAEAKAAGIPVLSGFNSDSGDPVPDGMFGNFTSDFTADAELGVKWALLDSGCAADMVMVMTSSGVVWTNMSVGAEKAIKQYCAECKIKVIDIDYGNLASSLGGQLQAALQLDPAINYVFPAGDSLVPYITPILATANSQAKVLSRDGVSASIEMIAAHSGQDMTLAMPDFKWVGWIAFDDVARQILKLPRKDYSIPTRIIDASNVGKGTIKEQFPAYENFRDVFTQTWAGK